MRSNGEWLRQHLFDCIRRGDRHGLLRSCRTYAEDIVALFDQWTMVPEPIRTDPRQIQEWAESLVAIAETLASLGRPEPRERLFGGGEANPFERWRRRFAEAKWLSESGQHRQSTAMLKALLNDMRGGPLVDRIRPEVIGLLGLNAVRAGAWAYAITHFQVAHDQCLATGDAKGVRIYRRQLHLLELAREIKQDTPAGRRMAGFLTRLMQAQDLSDRTHYRASTAILEDLLGTLDPEGAERRYRGKILGQLGSDYFRLRDVSAARRFTEQALEECRRHDDLHGVEVYTLNLQVIGNEDSDGAAD